MQIAIIERAREKIIRRCAIFLQRDLIGVIVSAEHSFYVILSLGLNVSAVELYAHLSVNGILQATILTTNIDC